jgi:RNA polymerase sigma-70 factor (sigma-E family)
VSQVVGEEPPATAPDLHFDDFFKSRYTQTVRLAGLLVGNLQTGEDIAEDAFARVVERWEKIEDPPAYLHRVVVNRARSHLRRASVMRRHSLQPALNAAGADEVADLGAARRPVRSALARLPRRQREAVVLRYYWGLTDAEVAGAMGLSVGAVKSHLHRATATLSEALAAMR